MFKRSIYFLSILSFFLLLSSYARAGVDAEVAYILNTFSFLVCGFLVMWMAAGFLFLESGLVTTRSVSTIAAKNNGVGINGYAIKALNINVFNNPTDETSTTTSTPVINAIRYAAGLSNSSNSLISE